MKKILAFDYGASSGRGILGRFDGNMLQLGEVHRFSNDPVMVNGSLYWDVLRLFHEMKQGMLKCVKNGEGDIAGIGVDTWGADFGLLDVSGNLLGNPFHYRDSRTEGMIEAACNLVPRREIYEQTGTAILKFNTLYQLLSMVRSKSPLLEQASTLLYMPDLLNYFLTGEKASEYTITSTAQMYNPVKGDWARDLLDKLGIPQNILTPVINAGTVLSGIRSDISEEMGMGQVPVIAVAGHDTGSAVVSVPATGERFVYLSSGTWSLMGVESSVPMISDTAYRLNYTNEGGFNRTTRLLKNIMGLWIYQECKRYWDKKGDTQTFDELEASAAQAKPFKAFIDPDHDMFYSPGNMPNKVVEFCRKTGQPIPETKGEIVRCVMESLALKYRVTVEGLEQIVGYSLPVINIVGGGCKNTMLCQFTANATHRKVVAGPVEATAIGNLICQLIALGEVAGLEEGRELVRKSFPTVDYTPAEEEAWNEAYGKFSSIIRQ